MFSPQSQKEAFGFYCRSDYKVCKHFGKVNLSIVSTHNKERRRVDQRQSSTLLHLLDYNNNISWYMAELHYLLLSKHARSWGGNQVNCISQCSFHKILQAKRHVTTIRYIKDKKHMHINMPVGNYSKQSTDDA